MCHYIVLIFCIESEDLKSIKLTEPNFLEKFILYLTWAIFVENGKILRSVIVEKKKKTWFAENGLNWKTWDISVQYKSPV